MAKASAVLYKPLGIAAGLAGAAVASMVFRQVWKRVAGKEDAPGPTEREYSWSEVLIAATIQGAIFGVVKAAIDRGAATGFKRVTGSWPGD